MSEDRPRRPRGLDTPGRALWDRVTDEFELNANGLALLEQACRVRDSLTQLDAEVSRDGVVVDSPQGRKAHPALVEGRQQRLALARLLGVLNVPENDDEPAVSGPKLSRSDQARRAARARHGSVPPATPNRLAVVV